jgi:hypothetical protein
VEGRRHAGLTIQAAAQGLNFRNRRRPTTQPSEEQAMKHLVKIGLVGLMSGAALLDAGSSPAAAQSVLSAQKAGVLATPDGRLRIGRGKDYVPSTVEPQPLFNELEGSMKKRRDFAWKVIEQVLQPVKIKLLDGVTDVEVPLWQTWYEGRPSGASANQELPKIFELYFTKLKPVLAANPNADVGPVIAATIKDFSTKDLSASLSDDNLSSVLHQLTGAAGAADAGRQLGQGPTMFSPSFVEHALKQARKIDECNRAVATADRDPPSPTQFSHCVEEFPRSAVMIKTSWRQLSMGIPRHDTTASAMSQVIKEGTWPGPGRADLQPPQVNPDRSQIYTNISSQGTEWALTGIHFVTKDVREWVWVSLWWDPDATKDFGADRPASIDPLNGGVWKNYKMCVSSAFAERDPQPWSSYTGSQGTLGASIKAVYDAIQTQITTGSISRPQDFQFFFGFTPSELPGALGPWPAPHNAQTSWCSNPNVETHAANARTSCIGCHQIAFTRNERRNNANASFVDVLDGDVPQFGRSLARKNFTAEFSWSFEIEFRPSIALGKAAAQFNWPQN